MSTISIAVDAGTSRRVAITTKLRRVLYEDAMLDLGGVADTLSNLIGALDSPKYRKDVADRMSEFNSIQRVLDALEWAPDGGPLEIDATDDLQSVVYTSIRHQKHAVEGTQGDLKNDPANRKLQRSLRENKAVYTEVVELHAGLTKGSVA